MMLVFILVCVAIMVADEARRKGYDLEKMRDVLKNVEEWKRDFWLIHNSIVVVKLWECVARESSAFIFYPYFW